jgi:hypothetical protein
MLAGCFQCISAEVFDVASEYETAAGRAVLSLDAQMGDL